MSAPRLNFLRAWWPALVWIGLIVVESRDFFSSENTASWLYALLTRVFDKINYPEFLIFHRYLRKAGHVLGYGMLAVLLLRGWRATLDCARIWSWRTALLAWIGTAFVASMDEWHQSFIPSRMGSPRDVVLDSVAGLIFLLVAYTWLRRSRTAEQTA